MKNRVQYIVLICLGLAAVSTACTKLEVPKSNIGAPQFYLQAPTDTGALNIYAGRGYEMQAYDEADSNYSGHPLYFSRFVQDKHDSLGFSFILSPNSNSDTGYYGQLKETLLDKTLDFGNPFTDKGKLAIVYVTDKGRYATDMGYTSENHLIAFNMSSYTVPARSDSAFSNNSAHTAYKVNILFSCKLHNVKDSSKVMVLNNASAVILFDAIRKK